MGQTQADPIDPDTRRAMAALSHPGVGGFSVTANPGAPNVGSVTANPGMPNVGSALSPLSPQVGLPQGQGAGMAGMISDAFATAMGRAALAMQLQPRLFGGSTDSQG